MRHCEIFVLKIKAIFFNVSLQVNCRLVLTNGEKDTLIYYEIALILSTKISQ
jgi:hypothetical protein